MNRFRYIFALLPIVMSSCGGSDEVSEQSYRYEHVALLAGDFVDAFKAAEMSDVEMQYMLLDIRSRADKLADTGEELLAQYFIAEFEEQLSVADKALADSLFSNNHKSVFLK